MPVYYIGLMSGTSMDAIDAALIDCSNNKIKLVAHYSQTFCSETRNQISALCQGCDNELQKMQQLDIELGKQFANCANQLLKNTKIKAYDITAIGSHGQTLRHYPEATIRNSLQIADPNTIAQLTGITTVADFRRRDMAAGGQGAPLVPAFHEQLFRNTKNNRVILNLGGIANITILPNDKNKPITGFDTGPASTLMDYWIGRQENKSYDDKGEWAASGKINSDFLQQLLNDAFFKLPPPKSTGTDYFSPAWFSKHLEAFPFLSSEDVQATLCECTAVSVANAIKEYASNCNEVFVCGGGAQNNFLMNRLQAQLKGIKVTTTDTEGIASEWIEAMAFAWLAKQTLNKQPGNVSSVTGAAQPVILGGIYSTV
ncbi:Anhydro-N-acetylmuramic acid kinase [hydrothermal vent metagenome]|uniref:Anhydro-N-acetylmuramic acid kinase n=1 Tax=hydrothermal vent metagenome TaxID=652676 RepID=A0A3B1A298_9ZZZZ